MRSSIRIHGWLLGSHFRRHRLRILTTIGGITIGVASILAISTINRSTYASFKSTVQSIAGRAQLEIANGAVGVPDGMISELEALPGVFAAAGVIQEFVRVPELGDRQVCILGVDVLQQSPLWDGMFDRDKFELRNELDVVAEAGSILLSKKLIDEGGYRLGDKVEVLAPAGRRVLTIRGWFVDQRFANVFQGDVGIMDVLPAQVSFVKEGRFDWINLAYMDGTDPDETRDLVERTVAGRAQVASPAMRGERVESMLMTNRWMLSLASLVAMVVALFLITLSMFTSIDQRQEELAILRCLGATRAHLVTLVMLEAGTVAVIGSALGVVAGIAACSVAVSPFGGFVTATYMQVRPDAVEVAVVDIVTAVGIAIAATLTGAFVPLRRVLKIDPIRRVLAHGGAVSSSSALLPFIGAALLAGGVMLPLWRLPREWYTAQLAQPLIGIVASLIGASILVPTLLRWTGPIAKAALVRLWGPIGSWLWIRISSGGLRTSLTIGALASGFAFATLMGTMMTSYRTAISHWIENSYPADLTVSAGQGLSMLSGPVAGPEARAKVAAMEGVRDVMPVRFVEATLDGKPMIVQGLDDRLFEKRYGWAPPDRSAAVVNVVISDTLMERFDLHEGDRFDLDTPTGPIVLHVDLVEADYMLDLGSVKIPWSVFSPRWHETRTNWFLVDLDDAEAAPTMKAAIDAEVGAQYDVTVMSASDTRATLDMLVAATFALMVACQALALVVAIIAVMNGVAAVIIDRRPQLALLRAIGLTPTGLRRLVMAEGATLGLYGAGLGLVVGAVNVYTFTTQSLVAVAGFHLPIVWPVGSIAAMLALGSLGGAFAAYLAVRRVVVTPSPLEYT